MMKRDFVPIFVCSDSDTGFQHFIFNPLQRTVQVSSDFPQIWSEIFYIIHGKRIM